MCDNDPGSRMQLLTWRGSKFRILPWLLAHFPPTGTYQCFLDLFGGSAAVVLGVPKTEGLVKVYNDIDQELVNFFRTLRDPVLGEQLIEQIQLTPHSRKEYTDAITFQPKTQVERAWRFYVLMNQSYSATGYQRAAPGNFGYSRTTPEAETLSKKARLLPLWARRLLDVTIENLDYRDAIRRYDSDTTLIYADPPYLIRSSVDKTYRHELLTAPEHEELAYHLKRCRGYVVLSGYPNQYYAEWYEQYGWRRFDRKVRLLASPYGSSHQQGMKSEKPYTIESIWVNEKVQASLTAGRQERLFDEWGHD